MPFNQTSSNTVLLQNQYDSFLHYRRRWDTAVTEEIGMLKEKTEEQDKLIRELRCQVDENERKLRAEIDAKTQDIGQLYDLLRNLACGCDTCKQTVDSALHLNL